MNHRPTFVAAAVLAFAALGAGLLRAQEEPVADGLPSLVGEWDGRISMKGSVLEPSVPATKVKQDCHLAITQNGPNINAVLTLPQEGEDVVYYLHGQVGNGSFWLTGDTTGFGTPLTLIGKASGSPGSLKFKASGVAATTDTVLTVGLQAKQAVL